MDGHDLMGRMVDALVAKDVEVSKMRKHIKKLTGRLDKTVGFVNAESLRGKPELQATFLAFIEVTL